jgi:hypothetical protein
MKKILLTLIVLTPLALSSCLLGCGGKSNQPGGPQDSERGLYLLQQSSQAMSAVNSYRISGSIVGDAQEAGAPDQNKHMTSDIKAEVQITSGEIRKHEIDSGWNPDKPDLQSESYMIGAQYYYKWLPTDDWKRNPDGAYVIMSNPFLNLIDKDQVALMAKMAQNVQIVEDYNEEVEISFQLDDDYQKALADAAIEGIGQSGQLTQDELQSLGQDSIGFQAEIHMWLAKDGNLIKQVTMDGTETTSSGQITGTNDMRLYDYDQGLQVALPEEAKNAPSI